MILMISGGHGFKVLEEIKMIEVKQGPYAKKQNNTRFEGVYSLERAIRGNLRRRILPVKVLRKVDCR